MDLALEHDVIQKSGSFFSYGELRLGQGRNNTKQFLAENPEPAAEIEAKLFEALGIEPPGRGPGGRGCRTRRPRRRGGARGAREGCLTPRRTRHGRCALRALARRELTVAELEARLEARGFEPEVVHEVVERLERGGRPRRRALRAPLRRGQARARGLGRGADPSRPAGARRRRRADRRGAGRRTHEGEIDARARAPGAPRRGRRRRGRARPRLASWFAAATPPRSPTTRSGRAEAPGG